MSPGGEGESDGREKMQKTEEKLCFAGDFGKDQSSMKEYKRLVKEAKFICKGCGRVATSGGNLCSQRICDTLTKRLFNF